MALKVAIMIYSKVQKMRGNIVSTLYGFVSIVTSKEDEGGQEFSKEFWDGSINGDIPDSGLSNYSSKQYRG